MMSSEQQIQTYAVAYGGVSGDTWLMLTRGNKQRGRWFADMHRRPDEGQHASLGGFQYGVKITAEGRAKYWESWEVNHAKYPDIDAPNPREKA